MSIGQNLKILRKKTGKSQEEIASELGLTRSSYSGYENAIAQPGIDQLVIFSDYFKIPIDVLIRKDLTVLTDKDLDEMAFGAQVDITGKQLRVLTTLVNSENEEMIEMVPMKASAGYTSGYSDPEYLKVLPTLYLPFLSKNKKYRSFPIQGDSMPPVVEGSQVVAEFVQNWMTVRSGTPCIVVTKEEGIVFKIVHNFLQENQSLQLSSTNPFYAPYEVKAIDILEIWKFVNYISPELPEVQMDENTLTQSIKALQREVHDLKRRIVN
jgi:transcriptional regulator with XRE-family HTH domain